MNTATSRLIHRLFYAVALLTVVSCGGGGGGGGDSSGAINTLLGGNAVKGPVNNAEVKLFYFDEQGQEVELEADNAPVMTDENGGFMFDAPFNELPADVGPGILRTIGGTTDPDNGVAPTLEAVIPDLGVYRNKSALATRHLSTASSVAAGLLKLEAATLAARPGIALTNALVDRVEIQLGVDLDDDPALMTSSTAAVNRSVDALLSLQVSAENNAAINEYVEYLVANLASTSGTLDGEMRDATTGVDMQAAFESPTLAVLFPGGPEDLRELRLTVDKAQIENDGLDSAMLSVSVHDGTGTLVLDPGAVNLKIVAGQAILGKETLSKLNDKFDVRLSSTRPGSVTVEASYVLENGAVLTQTVPVEVVDRIADTEDTVSPKVVSAVAISNTEVIATFTEALRGGLGGAENPAFYSMTAVDVPGQPAIGAYVDVIKAVLLAPDYRSVLLTTQSQSGISYTLQTSNLRDLAGNSFEPPTTGVEGDSPSNTTFVGIPPSGLDIVDSDGDGLSDSDELFGWAVTTIRPSGLMDTHWVTSDPQNKDTDGDRVNDNEEKHGAIDPRSADTDGDTLTDNQEWNVIYSDPANQDTDGDGTQDGFEFYSFRTSPVLADTDGDQISDTDEVLARNRDPRIADLPLHGINIGDVRLQIDERFTFEDVQGETVTTESSSSVTLTHGERSTRAISSKAFAEAMITLKAGIEFGPPALLPKKIELGADVQYKGGVEVQISRESTVESQRVREESFAKARELSESSTVTREIVGARIDVELSLTNPGDLAFSISNVEVTVLARSRESTNRFVPVATLVPNTTLITGNTATFNLGPFTAEHGPILFSSSEVFPNLVDELMQSPSGLIFEVANFDITDEFGRLFTFSNQIARDRTAGIIIDYGGGRLERQLVATALQPDPEGFGGTIGGFVGGFNADGSPKGIPLEFALQDILGLPKNASVVDGIVAGVDQTADSTATGDDIQLIPPGTTGVGVGSIVVSAGQNGVLDSAVDPDDIAEVTTGYATSATCSAASDKPREICEIDNECKDPALSDMGSCTGPETLARIGSLSTGDFDRQWVVLTTGHIPAGAEFGQLTLKAGDDLYFAFVQDLDEDGIFAREEFLYGSTDSRADLFDNESFGIVAPFTKGVPRVPDDESFSLKPPILGADGVFDSKDTDRDGLGDFAEIRIGWKVSADGGLLQQVFSSPRLADSDGDGLLDPQEQDLRKFCFSPFGDGVQGSLPDDGRIDALCSFESAPEVVQTDAITIIAGANGIAESRADPGDKQLIPPGMIGLTFGTPVVGPGADDIMVTPLGGDDEYVSVESSSKIPPASNPTLSDTDFDGVEDFSELTGFLVGVSIKDGLGITFPEVSQNMAQSKAIGDDVQQAFFGGPVSDGGVVVLPGPNGTIESSQGGDDELHFGETVVTDPLRRDTDADLVSDGLERDKGGNPRNPDDGNEFRDSDQDGLSDTEETILGWLVSVNGETATLVLSNPNRPDSDFDGLPDFAERVLHTDPNNADTDGDGLRDFDEVAGTDFEQFFGLDQQFPRFFVDGASSEQYGTDPTRTDTDEDTLTDYFELVEGYRVLIGGESSFRQVFTNPLVKDTDLDGVFDDQEASGTHYTAPGVPGTVITDATDPDTDNDGRSDGIEWQSRTHPLIPDISVRVKFTELNIREIGADPEPAGGANVPQNEIGWYFTVRKSGEDGNGALLSSAHDLFQPPRQEIKTTACDNPPQFPGDTGCVGVAENAGAGQTPNCWLLQVHNEAQYNIKLDKTRTVRLEEGDTVTIAGILYENDFSGYDCGEPPWFIPSLAQSECVTRFRQTWSFDDFKDGGQATFPAVDGSGTEEGCVWDVGIEVEAQ